uniref:Uncharacterized protein MANES_16G110800 n=1 Tax=Rhizophora mucronata TaxID=61149 RepID=A0A2P2KFJ5_RHIMU
MIFFFLTFSAIKQSIVWTNLTGGDPQQSPPNSRICLPRHSHLDSYQLPNRQRFLGSALTHWIVAPVAAAATADSPLRGTRPHSQSLLYLTRSRRRQRPLQRSHRRRSRSRCPLRLRDVSQRPGPGAPARGDEDLVGRFPDIRVRQSRRGVGERRLDIRKWVKRHGRNGSSGLNRSVSLGAPQRFVSEDIRHSGYIITLLSSS